MYPDDGGEPVEEVGEDLHYDSQQYSQGDNPSYHQYYSNQ